MVFLIAFGGMWVSMPMIYLCDLHSGSPHDTIIFSIIDPYTMDLPGNEFHFEWAIAEIRARLTALCFISALYFCGLYFYKRYREAEM